MLSAVLLSCCFIFNASAHAPSSYPFIAGETFRSFCQHCLDLNSNFDPHTVVAGDAIMVRIGMLDTFFKHYHPLITVPYILLTHNISNDSDESLPGIYKSYLDDPQLYAWFTKNKDCDHPKLYGLPLGLANQEFQHGNLALLKKYIDLTRHVPRDKLVYMNFNIATYPPERQLVYDFFKNKSFVTQRAKWEQADYMFELISHKFVLSPRGNGIDCHRTWETLLMGAVPIVKSCELDPLYEDLPVLIVQQWSDVTEEFLEKKYTEFSKKSYRFEKMYAPYWLALIRQEQDKARACIQIRKEELS